MSINLEGYASINQSHQSNEVSDKYGFIPTTRVLRVLENEGWMSSKINEARVLDDTKHGYQKNMVRLRQTNSVQVGDVFPEIVLTNSHNGLASFQVMA